MTARIFRNGRNQAVRIPVDMSFDTDTVTIEQVGSALLVRPLAAPGWDRFFDDPSMILPADFSTGDDPSTQERDPF